MFWKFIVLILALGAFTMMVAHAHTIAPDMTIHVMSAFGFLASFIFFVKYKDIVGYFKRE